MPAIAVDQSAYFALTDRLRGQARSHSFECISGHADQQLAKPAPNMGAGLPAIAVDQSALFSLKDRLREQARSHSFLTAFQATPISNWLNTPQMWELACLR